MRLIRITTNYPTYTQQFYTQYSEVKGQPYAVQYQSWVADCFGWADYWSHAFGKLGYEVWEPVGNAESMQKAWALEQGISYREETWLTDIVAAQVSHFQPDVLFVNDYSTYSAQFLRHLRNETPSIQCTIGWCGAPFADESVFQAYDLVLSNIPSLVHFFQDKGHRSTHIHHAFEPRVLNYIDRTQQSTIPFSFIGSVFKGNNFHREREQLLKQLVQSTCLEIWSDLQGPSSWEMMVLPLKQKIFDGVQVAKSLPGGASLLAMLPKLKNYAKLEHRPSLDHYIDSAIIARAHLPLFGRAMFQKLYDSKVTLNTHIDISGQFASNMRLYEATGVGTCLLTDWKPNLHQLFEPEQEVVTYRSPEEAIEKVKYLLENEAVRNRIAAAGQRRTLRDHTFDLRAQQIDSFIKKMI